MMKTKHISLKSLSDEKLKTLSKIPVGGFQGDVKESTKIWLAACWEARRRDGERHTKQFASKGSAQRWFTSWKPKSAKAKRLANILEEMVRVVETYYKPIEVHGLERKDDMGLLQSGGRSSSEGIRVKKSPADDCVLLQICCTTGPTNHDPVDNIVEVEHGSKSHVMMLCYRELPSSEDLEADICAYPLVTCDSNYKLKSGNKNLVYISEGFVSSKLRNEGIVAYAPWNKLTERKQNMLMNLEEIHLNLDLTV